MILTIAHSKGGTGKSTLAWNIANYLHTKEEITIVDLDFQQTLFYLNEIRKTTKLSPVKVLQPKSANELIELFETYTGILIVDVGGYDNDINRIAISWADKVVVPISDSITDVLGFKTFEAILKEIDNPFINIVLNNIHPLTRNFDTIKKAIGDEANLLKSIIRTRKIYKTTLGTGKSIIDTNHILAIDEIKRLSNELRSDK